MVDQDQGESLTFLIGGVQWFVRLDEQEAIGSADRDEQVLVDLICLNMEYHPIQIRTHLIWEQLKSPGRRQDDDSASCSQII